MLKFQTYPDREFMVIFQESIFLMIDQLREVEENLLSPGESLYDIEYLLPNAGRVFNAGTAIHTLRQMLKCHRDAWLYVLNDYHYLLLYDTLQYFCEIYNDTFHVTDGFEDGEHILTVEGIHIERIDFEDLVAMYFYDMDFLLDAETVIKLGLDRRKTLGIKAEAFNISQGLAPNHDELKIKPSDNDDYDWTENPAYWS